ncbi:MAG: amidohydrolase [Clostridia bacterium]|nr:amidohydrolase [Clostridia bacterium]
MSGQILIQNAKVLTMTDQVQQVIDADILIEGQYIKKIGTITDLDKDVEIINGKNCLALPGLINCHTHAAMTLLRGYADDMELMPWLEQKIWPQEEKMKGEHIYWGSMLAVLEMIKSGTTTFADMYSFMDEVAKAVELSGIRAVLSRGLIGFKDQNYAALKESKDFVKKWHKSCNGRITCTLAPHAPYTCPPDYLQKVLEAAQELEVGIHIHLAETKQEFNDILEQYGKTPTRHVYDLGLFQVPVLAAHCVYLTEEDIELMAEGSVGVAHNPTSNMKLASGMAPIPSLLKAGVNVGIGTDGTASNNNLNMIEEMHIASLLHKVSKLDPTSVPAYQALEMGTVLGARVLNLDNEIGTLEPGKKADIIFIDLNQPHLCPAYDLVANLIYSAQGSDVKTSIIDGKIIMKDRQVLTIDEEKVMFEARRYAFSMLD